MNDRIKKLMVKAFRSYDTCSDVNEGWNEEWPWCPVCGGSVEIVDEVEGGDLNEAVMVIKHKDPEIKH